MRRSVVLASLTLLVAACGDLKVDTVQNKPYNSLFVVAPLALATPPLNTVLFGPCKDEFAMPGSRRENCELYYRLRGRTTPWQDTAARAQAMTYGPGELQCWRTLGSAECIAIGGPPRTVNLIGPNMGAN